MSELKIYGYKILSLKVQEMLVSLLTQVTGWPRETLVCTLHFLWDSRGEHLIELISFTLRCCDLLLLLLSLWIKLSSVFQSSKRYEISPSVS